MVVYRYQTVVVVVALIPVLLVGACSSGGDSPFSPTSGGSIRLPDFVASTAVDSSDGQLKSGFAPSASGGPTVTVSGNQTVVNGGATELDVMAGAAFTRVFVFMAGESLGLSDGSSTGLGDYYEIALPASQASAALLLTFPQVLPTAQFDLFFSVADDTGAVGPVTRLTFDVIQVGTGDVQVTLAWDADSDVDLHVIDPNGDEVYWANREVASGGQLDLDSNAGCGIDGIRNENVTWPVGTAPQGTYTVRVDYWSSCGVGATDYTVLVNNGGNVEVFSGRFTGDGDQGGAGAGIDITTFMRSTGPAATTSQRRQPAPPTGPTRK